MKKVFNLLVSFVLLAGFSACNKDNPGNQQQVPENPSPTPPPGPTMDYKGLRFISSGESTVKLKQVGLPLAVRLEYSTDGTRWMSYTIDKKIDLADGGFVLFRAGDPSNRVFSRDSENHYQFVISGSVTAQGNIMSLFDRDFTDQVPEYAFFALFKGCTSLMSAPELPATTLKVGCYCKMFQGCTSLTSAPVLPVKDLVRDCYLLMFDGCSKLQYVKALFTTEPSKDTTGDWLRGVAASGTFVKSKDATWNVTGVHGIPQGWKVETE